MTHRFSCAPQSNDWLNRRSKSGNLLGGSIVWDEPSIRNSKFAQPIVSMEARKTSYQLTFISCFWMRSHSWGRHKSHSHTKTQKLGWSFPQTTILLYQAFEPGMLDNVWISRASSNPIWTISWQAASILPFSKSVLFLLVASRRPWSRCDRVTCPTTT